MELSPLLSVLRCAGCRSDGLRDRGTALECPQCGRSFPVQAGVPVMLEDVVPDRGMLLDPEAAAALMERLGIPAGPVNALRVRRASAARVRLRAGAGGWPPGDGRVLAAMSAGPAVLEEGEPRCEWLAEYLPRAMRPGEEVLANVRFRNAGTATMASSGDRRTTVACQWAEQAGGDVVAETRTPLPANLAPGQSVTIPIRLQAPLRPGRAVLSLSLVQESVRWLEPSYGPFCVHVHPGAGFSPPPGWVLDGPTPLTEAADRIRSLALMRDWIARLGVPRPRVLQLGGGARPVAGQGGYETVIVDDDLLALQLGELIPRPPDAAVQPVCAGLADLPLAEAAFDAATCFGLLHLQADPARVLRNLRAHVRPGGFIALFREPVGHIWPKESAAGPGDSGQNTFVQLFSLFEYECIFKKAHLRVAELAVDGASLKARLVPE